jgi:hypothetical protein
MPTSGWRRSHQDPDRADRRNLVAFQQKLIDAVSPFTVATGSAGRIHHHAGRSQYQPADDRLCGALVPASSGAKFEPHVTVGVAPPDDLKALVAKPFDACDFAPAALSVYQLGDFGTARKILKTWQFTP